MSSVQVPVPDDAGPDVVDAVFAAAADLFFREAARVFTPAPLDDMPPAGNQD